MMEQETNLIDFVPPTTHDSPLSEGHTPKSDKELDRAQKERQKEKEATIAALTKEFDEIQARMDVDHELVVRMIHEEQEMYTIEERARLLVEYFERIKKQFAAKRAEAIRNKSPTRTQVRNKMVNYLKHMEKRYPLIKEMLEKMLNWKLETEAESTMVDRDDDVGLYLLWFYMHGDDDVRTWITYFVVLFRWR
uniref:Uncharacterized protein n=1 Tax=Tanacetum cinerariifolium TaxID=118510 RepID=A0A6L2L693_TANCI|nr:hypothetical protein [Tanacetum cinerariifolium]